MPPRKRSQQSKQTAKSRTSSTSKGRAVKRAAPARTKRKTTRKAPDRVSRVPEKAQKVAAAPKKQRRTIKAQTLFLAEYRRHGIISKACEAAGVVRTTFYDWDRDDEEFRAQALDALGDVKDAVDAEIRRRGEEGWEAPVIHRGELAQQRVKQDGVEVLIPLTVRKFSDRLLLARAQALMPDKYGEHREVRIGGSGGGPVRISVAEEQRALLDKINANPAARAAANSLVESLIAEEES